MLLELKVGDLVRFVWGKHGAYSIKTGIYLREGPTKSHRVAAGTQEFGRAVILYNGSEIIVPLSHVEEIISSAPRKKQS